MPIILNISDVVGKGYDVFWNTKKRYRIVIGGRASKKSTTTALWYIVHMMQFKEANTLVVRRYYSTHKDSTFAQLKWAIRRLGVEHLWMAKLSPLELIYKPTGQKIIFRGLDDPLSLTSLTVEQGVLCWVWFEELFQVEKEEDFDTVDLSIRGQVKPPLFKQITGTLNPYHEKHWVKKRFFDNPNDNVFTAVTNYTCNEFLDEADIKVFETMKIENPARYRVEGLGEWGQSYGNVFEKWYIEDFSVEDVIAKYPNVKAVFGLDFGYVTDPTAFVAALVDTSTKNIWIFDEHYQKGMTNEMIYQMIARKNFTKERIIADSAEAKSIDHLRWLGLSRITKSQKGRGSVMTGINYLREFNIYVRPTLTNTILELSNYSLKDGKPIDEFNHIVDALRYAVEGLANNSKTKAIIL